MGIEDIGGREEELDVSLLRFGLSGRLTAPAADPEPMSLDDSL